MFDKEIYIAKRLRIETNYNGYDVEYFEKPKRYRMNYQPLEGVMTYSRSGENTNSTQYVAFVDRNVYQGIIRTGDKAYLSDESILEEDLKQLTLYDNEYCEQANYRVISVLPQNKKMKIVFKKILDSEVL